MPVVGVLLVAPLPAQATPEGGAAASSRAALRSGTAVDTTRAALARAGRDSVRLGAVLRAGGRPADVVTEARKQGAATAHRLDALHYVSVQVPRAAAQRVADALARRADVARVERVPVRAAQAVPNDPYYGNEQTYLTSANVPAAWDVTHGSVTTKVAVIDTGIDQAHPDLVGKIAGVHNSMATAPSPTSVTDDLGHGTHVAGIVAAATGNGVGVSAAGYDTSVLAIKAGDEYGFSDDDLSAGILWAVSNGARVINMSLGGPQSSTVLNNAVAYAQQQGVLVVAAAGNHDPTQPYTSVPMYPAAIPGVIAVGATDAIGNRAAFSDYGSWVSVAAPGTGIWSTIPTAGAADFPGVTTGYAPGDGTSMASPMVAAEAGLLFGLEPFATMAQVRSAIVSSAHGYAGLGLGTGQVDFAAALDRLPPASVPSLTSPTPAVIVGGVVSLVASTTNGGGSPTVRFLVDGAVLGAPVAVSGGTASLDWQSWGRADGTHTLSVQDCNQYGCGQASTPVSVTLQNVAPSLSAPASGSAVSNGTDLTIAVTDGAPKVLAKVDGQPVGAPVAVSSGTAHVMWPTVGYANGAHTVTVAACDSSGSCGSSSSSSLNVSNVAPTITAPKVGQMVSGSFTLAASAASGAVQFLVDGAQVGFDTTSPYTAAVNFSSYADGTHTLLLRPCTVTKSQCAGPSTSRSITVRSLHPSITKAAPTVFSPNGDKRADTTTLTYYLPDTESVWWGIKNSAGTVVRGPYSLGTLGKGTRTFLWNGNLANATRAPNGTYTAYVTTKAVTSGSTLYGYATRSVRLDTVAPSLSVVAPATGFYPYTDGYRDTVVAKATTNEPGLMTLTARNSGGSVVRTINVSHSGTGTYNLTWNGRDNSGRLVPTGTYKVQITAQDVALNRRASTTYSVVVSLKKLVPTTVSKVVTAAASKTSVLAGDCSAVASSGLWTGGLDYLSDYYCYDPYDSTSDIAASDHALTLPAAVKYSGLSVTVTGQERLSGYGDSLFAWYRDPAGNLMDPGVECGPAYGARSIGAAPTSYLYGGRTLRWTVATAGGMYYAVRAFTVRYTYYVLA